MCLRSLEPASSAMLLLQWGASSDAAVVPGTIKYAQSPVSREDASRTDQQNKDADRAAPLPW